MTCPCGCGAFPHWCAGCGQPENPDGAYRICGECGHVFPTGADLVAQDLDAQRAGLAMAALVAIRDGGRGDLRPPRPSDSGDEIRICPVCNHDF